MYSLSLFFHHFLRQLSHLGHNRLSYASILNDVFHLVSFFLCVCVSLSFVVIVIIVVIVSIHAHGIHVNSLLALLFYVISPSLWFFEEMQTQYLHTLKSRFPHIFKLLYNKTNQSRNITSCSLFISGMKWNICVYLRAMYSFQCWLSF